MVSKTYELNPFFPFQILISNPYWHQSKTLFQYHYFFPKNKGTNKQRVCI